MVPKEFDDSMLENAATFRMLCRFPSAVWRHEGGSVLLRASQPVVGVFCQRNTDDENLLQVCSPKRSYATQPSKSWD